MELSNNYMQLLTHLQIINLTSFFFLYVCIAITQAIPEIHPVNPTDHKNIHCFSIFLTIKKYATNYYQ